MKELYSFSVTKEDGKSVRLILAKPTPRQHENAEFEYAAVLSKHVRAGVLTRAMLFKRYEDTGGLLPENVRIEQLQSQKDLFDKNLQLVRLQSKKTNTAEEKIEMHAIIEDIGDIRRRMVAVENMFDSVYNQTADRLTQTRMVYWWMFELGYCQEEEDAEPKKLFQENGFEANKDKFYSFEDDESAFATAVRTKLFGLISFWYYGNRVTTDDMDQFLGDYFADETKEEKKEETAEEVPESPAPPVKKPRVKKEK